MTQLEYTQRRIQELTETCKRFFGRHVDVAELHFDDINAPQEALVSIFSDGRGNFYAVVTSPKGQSLRDMKKYIKSVGLDLLKTYAPYNDEEYFVRRGREIFLQAYPGRTSWTEQEKRYYTSLVPTTALLARISPHFHELRRYNEVAGRWQLTYDEQDVETTLAAPSPFSYYHKRGTA